MCYVKLHLSFILHIIILYTASTREYKLSFSLTQMLIANTHKLKTPLQGERGLMMILIPVDKVWGFGKAPTLKLMGEILNCFKLN